MVLRSPEGVACVFDGQSNLGILEQAAKVCQVIQSLFEQGSQKQLGLKSSAYILTLFYVFLIVWTLLCSFDFICFRLFLVYLPVAHRRFMSFLCRMNQIVVKDRSSRVCPQQDQWSCGHRLILSVRFLLSEGIALKSESGWMVDLRRLRIDEDALSQEEIKALCVLSATWAKPEPSEQSQLKRPQICAFGCVSTQPSAKLCDYDVHSPSPSFEKKLKADPATAQNVRKESSPTKVGQKLETPVKVSKPELKQELGNDKAAKKQQDDRAGRDPKTSKNEAVPEEKRQKTKPEQDLQSKKAKPVPEQVQQTKKAKPVPEQLDVVLAARADTIRSERKMKKEQKQIENVAKQILRHAGLDFNDHFQKYHHGHLPAGHWAAFLRAVHGPKAAGDAEETDINCSECKKLMLRFNLLDARNAIRGKPEEQALIPYDSLEAEICRAVMDAEKEEEEDRTEGRERSRRGRPRKGNPVEFNILDFLKAERADMYEVLTEEQALWICLRWLIFSTIYIYILIIVVKS